MAARNRIFNIAGKRICTTTNENCVKVKQRPYLTESSSKLFLFNDVRLFLLEQNCPSEENSISLIYSYPPRFHLEPA